MLKLLRNFALAGLLLAGVMKLLAWWAGGRDAEHLVAALAPYAKIQYDSVSAGLDGSVSLDKVSVDAGHKVYRADSVVLESPGLFWLLAHAFLGTNSLPDQFSLEADGLKLPPGTWLDPQWLDPATFVPFAAAACGSGLSDADYQRMGAAVGPTHEKLDYRYDADQHTLNLDLALKAPGFAQVNVQAELKKYDASALSSSTMWDKVHVEQVSVDYADLDFLAKRNQFCAQRVGNANAAQFVERHIVAVQDLLKQKRAEASNELVQLYRTLLEQGGQASLLSLPSSGFTLAAIGGAPEELLRQLNVTARYKDKPPIMFRLAFAPAPEPEPAADATPAPSLVTSVAAPPAVLPTTTTPAKTPPLPTSASPTPTSPVATVAPVAAPPKPATAAPAATPPLAPAKPPVATVSPTPTPTPPLTPAKPPVATVSPTPAATTPVPPTTPASNKSKASDNLGLHNLDREEAKLAPLLPTPVKPATATPGVAKRDAKSEPGLGPSEEAPLPGSPLAMVWKPSVLETLPEAEPEQRNYDVVDYARVGSIIGRYVQVITEGGKKIGGYVLEVDDTGIKLRVNREGGNITFVVAKARVQQVRLPHS